MNEHITEQMVQCTNCGTTYAREAPVTGAPGEASPESACPVCYMVGTPIEVPSLRIENITELKEQLDMLMRAARASGLDTESIVRVLSDELAFAAEMGEAGRRFAVQLIDLGPQERESFRDRGELLMKRRGSI